MMRDCTSHCVTRSCITLCCRPFCLAWSAVVSSPRVLSCMHLARYAHSHIFMFHFLYIYIFKLWLRLCVLCFRAHVINIMPLHLLMYRFQTEYLLFKIRSVSVVRAEKYALAICHSRPVLSRISAVFITPVIFSVQFRLLFAALLLLYVVVVGPFVSLYTLCELEEWSRMILLLLLFCLCCAWVLTVVCVCIGHCMCPAHVHALWPMAHSTKMFVCGWNAGVFSLTLQYITTVLHTRIHLQVYTPSLAGHYATGTYIYIIWVI